MSAGIRGILPALVTPLTGALEQFPVYTAGADGVCPCGSTGAAMALPAAIRRTAAETGVRHSPAAKLGVPVLAYGFPPLGRGEVLAAGLPEWSVELYGHARAGRWEHARLMPHRIPDLIRRLVRFPLPRLQPLALPAAV